MCSIVSYQCDVGVVVEDSLQLMVATKKSVVVATTNKLCTYIHTQFFSTFIEGLFHYSKKVKTSLFYDNLWTVIL